MTEFNYGRNCRWYTIMPQRRSTGKYERKPPIERMGVCTFTGKDIRKMSAVAGYCEDRCPVKEPRY